MDRARCSWLALPAVSLATLLLAGAAWFGYWVGEGARCRDSLGRPESRPIEDPAEPSALGRLPRDVVPCAARLESTSDVVGQGSVSSGPQAGPSYEPASPPVELVDPRHPAPPTLVPVPESMGSASAAAPEANRVQDRGQESVPPQPLGDAPELPVATPQPLATAAPVDSVAPPSAIAEPATIEAPAATPWATPYQPGERSARLEQLAQQADSHTRRGFDLASRKAYYSARAEFVHALRVVAQGLDSEHRSQVHSQALSAGLGALEEADDFVPVGSQLEGDLDVATLISGHRTPVLKLADPDTIAPLEAVQRYVAYAREQLAIAAGGEVAGSMALHGLGKLHRVLAEQQAVGQPTAATKSLAFFEAAVCVCPENYLALNDVGVLLAHGGRYADARLAFERSLMLVQDPTALQNLAEVDERLGQRQMADESRRRAAAILAAQGKTQRDPTRPVPSVTWLPPDQFARSYAEVGEPAPAKRQAATPAPAQPVPAAQASRGWTWDIFTKVRK